MKQFKKFASVAAFALASVLIIQSVFAFDLVSSISSIFTPEQKVTVKLDGKVIAFPDTQPYVNEDNRTMVPVRFVAEAMHCDIRWDETNQLVIITKGGTRIVLQINQNWAIVNDGKTDIRKEFDTRAVLKNDRTMVPLRFVSETLGTGVAWDEKNNTVVIRSDGTVEQVASATPVPTPAPTPRFTPIIIDYQETHPTPTPTPTPVNQWKNKEVPMTLITTESDMMPEGFIKPQFVVKHLPDGSGGSYFSINLNNLSDYKNVSNNYAFKVTCLNYDLVNTYSGMNGLGRKDVMINLSGWFSVPTLNPSIWSSPSGNVKYNNYPEVGSVSIYPGVVLNMQVEFYYAGLKQIYRDSVELKAK